MAVLLTPPYLQFFDDNGNPLSGGKIYTYSAGTLTPKATFTDSSETTPLPNPIILDAAGRATIWISGSYYIDVRTSADVPVKNTDNITAFNTSSSSINSLLPSQTGNAGKALVTDGTNVSWGDVASLIRNHIDGYQMSTAGASTTMTIGAGQAANSTNAAYITLASSINKTTGSWAVGTGNGGLDTGTIANNTWYHFYAIRRPDTGVVDVVFSTNATSPTLPTNYTQFRRIGAWVTNGSGQWDGNIRQDGDDFYYVNPVADVNGIQTATTRQTPNLSVPTSLQFLTRIRAVTSGGVGVSFYTRISETAETDAAASASNQNLGLTAAVASANTALAGMIELRTNTSRQIAYRSSNTDASSLIYIYTHGWVDKRGKE